MTARLFFKRFLARVPRSDRTREYGLLWVTAAAAAACSPVVAFSLMGAPCPSRGADEEKLRWEILDSQKVLQPGYWHQEMLNQEDPP